MARSNPISYIAPSQISIIPNANGSPNDLAVDIAKGTKIKVFCPKLGIVANDGTYPEWTLTGKNRRLGDLSKPYTIYARLSKTDRDDAYLVFAPQVQNLTSGKWENKYASVTPNGLDAGQANLKYWYVCLGTISLPEDNVRTINLDTGILGTDAFNAQWAMNPDALPLRVELSAILNGEDAGNTPYVYWQQNLSLVATLVEGWTGTESERFDHWEISRNTGEPADDANWPDSSRATDFESSGTILLAHTKGDDDDFNAAVSSIFTITAWGRSDNESSDGSQLVPLCAASINIMAETLEKYELSISPNVVSYSPQTGRYTPEEGVAIKIRATDQRGEVSILTNAQLDGAMLEVLYAADGSSTETSLEFTGEDDEPAVAMIPISAFFAQKSVNVRLVNAAGIGLATQTVAFVRDGEDNRTKEWIYRKNAKVGYTSKTGTSKGVPVSGTTDGVYNCYLTDNFVPAGWTDHPSGVSSPGDTEYITWRDYNEETQRWGDFNPPVVWSHYGERGTDGDGLEYVFARSVTETPPTIGATDTYEGKTYLDDGYLPPVSGASTMQDGTVVANTRTTDESEGPNKELPFEWVALRTKGAPVKGVRSWNAYPEGKMALWAKWSDDGDPATVYRLLPSVRQVVKKKDGTYIPSANITCGVTKNVGGTQSTPAASEYTLRMKLNGGSEVSYSTTPPSSITSSLEFILYVGGVVVDRETIPLVEDGSNSVRLDIDNEMDVIPTDSSGKVLGVHTITTHLKVFDGSTQVTGFTVPAASDIVIGEGETDACVPSVSATDGVVTITWNFNTGDTFRDARYNVAIPIEYKGQTYTAVFTASLLKSGADGSFAFNQLNPSTDVVKIAKDGTFSRYGFICNVKKTTQDGTSNVLRTALPLGMEIRYSIHEDATKENQTLYADHNGVYENIPIVNSATTVGAFSAQNIYAVADKGYGKFLTLYLYLDNILQDRETIPFIADGLDGTSVTVSSNSTQYAASTSGTTTPSTGWQDSVPDVAKGAFLWTKVTTAYSDGTTATSYGVSYRGTDGTSPSILSTEIRYAASTSGTTVPTSGWQETIPFVAQKNYLWTCTRVTYSTASGTTTTTSYSVARAGADGDTGDPGADGYTTHFAYSTSSDGSQNFSTTNFDGATYIGTYRDQNEADSTDYTRYTWTRWRGVDGENVIHVDLDNENDAMLYDGSGNLISGSVTSNASLYDGTTKVSSGVTWSLPTKTNCTATITTAGVVIVTAMSATTGKVVVRATYKSKTYDAILSLKKLVGIDKYELVCTPNSVTYNTTTGNLSATAITIRVYKTAQNGTRTNISSLPSNYTLQGSETFSRAYSGGYATMPVNSSLSAMSVTLKDASGVVLDVETIPINKSTNGANGNDGKDAQPIRPNIIANGREERYITGTTNSNYPVSPSYSETSSGVTYSVFYGWRHLEIDYTQGERVIVSMNLRWNGLTAVSGATMRVRILMFTGSGNPTIFYKAITTASGEGRFESGSTPTSASGRYLCRVELAGCSAGTIWYSDVKAEIADDNTSTATPWLPCAHDYAGINPNILDYTKDGKNTEGNLMWVQSIANQGVMTIKEDDFALNNPVSYVDAASLSSTQTAIRDEGIVTIPANQPCIVSWDACYVGTEPYRWWLQLLDVNSSSHINIHYYCLGTSDSSYIIGAGKHLRQQTTNDEGWQRFVVYLDPVSSQRQFKIQFKHDGRNGDGTTSALHIRRVKAELSYFPSPWVISEDDKMGAAGLPGKDAVPAVYAGEWDSSAIYYYDNVRREIVLYNGHYYAVKTQGTTCTSADVPGVSAKWQAFDGEFRNVATDILVASTVLAARGWFDGLTANNITATNSDFQDVVIRGVLSKMRTEINTAEVTSEAGEHKYTALCGSNVYPFSSPCMFLNVWRCGDVVDFNIDISGQSYTHFMLPAAWHVEDSGTDKTQRCPTAADEDEGQGADYDGTGLVFASGHGFLLDANSTVRRSPTIDEIRGLVGRKMVLRNTGTQVVWISAPRFRRIKSSSTDTGDDHIIEYGELASNLIGRLATGEMLQVECCVDFQITRSADNSIAFEGYHWELFGSGIKYLV